MKKSFLRRISWLMVIIMGLTIIPTPVVATIMEEYNPNKFKEIGEQRKALETDADSIEEAEVLYEVESKREANVKHFRMSDGTIRAAIYPDVVHYEKNGKLVDIDNSLTEKSNVD